MRRSSSRLVFSLKGRLKSSKLEVHVEELPEERLGVVANATAPDVSKWNWEIASSRDVVDFLSSGRTTISSRRLETLKESTNNYLEATNPDLLRPSEECDQILNTLIEDHWALNPMIREVAIIACLPNFSVKCAMMHLISLKKLDVDHYLRCLVLASQIDQRLVSREERTCVQTLLQILSNSNQSVQKFGVLITGLISTNFGRYVCLATIRKALNKGKILMSMQIQIQKALDSQLLWSAYKLLSWLQNTSSSPVGGDILAILDEYLPSWYIFAIWRPNTRRIPQWENGTFDRGQRDKLAGFFKMDGPDLVTRQQLSLSLSEPECYKITQIHPETNETLETCLDTLYEASRVGPAAVNLFIHAIIDRQMCRRGRNLVAGGVQSGNDSYCRILFLSERLHDSDIDSTQKTHLVTESLNILATGTIPDSPHLSLQHIADCLLSTMSAAQSELKKRLLRGTGANIGITVQGLGEAAERASKIHGYLPPGFVDEVRLFPPRETLEALFDVLQDDGNCSSMETRFTSYLRSTIGGERASMEKLPLFSIQEELKFWQHSPDTLRIDFARKLGEMETVDYSLYTKCLITTLGEDDYYIEELKHIVTVEDNTCCIALATKLSERRALGQLMGECWLSLTSSLLNAQESNFFPSVADSWPLTEWIDFSQGLSVLMIPIHRDLPESGPGLTTDCLRWWKYLSKHRDTIEFLLSVGGVKRQTSWIYFPSSQVRVEDILRIAKDGYGMIPLHLQVISSLDAIGGNSQEVCDAIEKLKNLSSIGRIVCEHIFSRKQNGSWTESELNITFRSLQQSESLTRADKAALEAYSSIIISSPVGLPNLEAARSRRRKLQLEYEALLNRGKDLEVKRLKLQHKHPQKAAALLQKIGVECDMTGRAMDTKLPNELVDAVEVVGDQEYELSFALTDVAELQRQARGIPTESRMLLVRLCFKDASFRFCVHFSPNDEGGNRHQYWRRGGATAPPSRVCTTKPTLFSYYVATTLYKISKTSLESIYRSILTLITKPPTTCVACSAKMSVNLWKPATCSSTCSVVLRLAPLEVRLHNLLVDPLSVDLLLTCVIGAARDAKGLQLLTDCPIPITSLVPLIDSFPVLGGLSTAKDLQKAIKGSDGLGADREKLLSWLCISFRGFLMTVQNTYKIPSMPNTVQFLLLNSNREREQTFQAQTAATGSGNVLFHATQVSRLYPILREGLKVMSGTQFQAHGASHGSGIYCGNDQSMSSHYSGSTGPSWKNSVLGNMNVMLGCEVAANAQMTNHGTFTVVHDANSILVRYVFLLPQGYQPPPQHHVGPAMSTAFQTLRAGRGG